MLVIFDPKYNVAYIKLKDKSENVNSVRVTEDIIIALAPDGTLYGIELLNAKSQLMGDKKEKLRLLNELTGVQTEFEMPF